MDPNIALWQLADAIYEGDHERTLEQISAIAGWLADGGFAAQPALWADVHDACERALFATEAEAKTMAESAAKTQQTPPTQPSDEQE